MKNIYLLIILFAFIICLGTILIISHPGKKRDLSSYAQEENMNGSLELPIQSSSTVPEDDYTGAFDDGFIAEEYYVGFTNLNTVYDLLTLQALSEISSEAAGYLNEHGFGDVHSLTIIESSIVYDRSYPYFLCRLENVNHICLEIRYDIESMQFAFDLSSL